MNALQTLVRLAEIEKQSQMLAATTAVSSEHAVDLSEAGQLLDEERRVLLGAVLLPPPDLAHDLDPTAWAQRFMALSRMHTVDEATACAWFQCAMDAAGASGYGHGQANGVANAQANRGTAATTLQKLAEIVASGVVRDIQLRRSEGGGLVKLSELIAEGLQ